MSDVIDTVAVELRSPSDTSEETPMAPVKTESELTVDLFILLGLQGGTMKDVLDEVRSLKKELRAREDEIVSIARNKSLEILELLRVFGFSTTEEEASDPEFWRYMLKASVEKVKSLTTLTADGLGMPRDSTLSDVLNIATLHAKHDIETKKGEVPEWRDLMAEADRVIKVKGRDYTKGSHDRLANFKTSAEEAGITPLQAWLVFYNKHHSAICSFVKTGGQSESEPILGRFVDALNYIRLGWLLVKAAEASTE